MDTRPEIPTGGNFGQLHDLLGAIIDLGLSQAPHPDAQTGVSREQEEGISPGQDENQSDGLFEWEASTPPPEQVDELPKSPEEVAAFRQAYKAKKTAGA